MKKIFLIGFFILSLVDIAHAKVIHYTDDNGKIHYVNTDFSKIPPKYYYQVRTQLEPPTPTTTPAVPAKQLPGGTTPNNPLPAQSTEQTTSNSVVFLTKIGCKECDDLELQLRHYQIPYMRYDVEYDENGKMFYEDFGAGKLPLCRIGTQVVSGDNIQAILKLLQNKKPL